MAEQYYKIRRLSDGRHSTGGRFPNFTPVGRSWKNLENLKKRLQSDITYFASIYNDSVVVSFTDSGEEYIQMYDLLIAEQKGKK